MGVANREYYRRNLPHWHPKGRIFFITFRLAHSIPAHIVEVLETENEQERRKIMCQFNGDLQQRELYNLEKKFFNRFDSVLDHCDDISPKWLALEHIAQIVAEQIKILDGVRYKLLAYCIMSNHVHLLVSTIDVQASDASQHAGPTSSYPLADTLKLIKGRTARYCNQSLSRSGAFWQHESYDHVVRDASEFQRILWYILNNPVKANLVKNWDDWPFSYCVEQILCN